MKNVSKYKVWETKIICKMMESQNINAKNREKKLRSSCEDQLHLMLWLKLVLEIK